MTTLLEAAKAVISAYDYEATGSNIDLMPRTFKATTKLREAIAQELGSQAASTNHVVSQEPSETRDNNHQSRFFDL